jgi:DNA-binding NarL/FixJ family response regulator
MCALLTDPTREAAGQQTGTVPGKLRLLIADDNPRVLDQVAATLGASFDLVARVFNGRDAVDQTIAHSPDVLVLDISMPGMSGLGAAEQLRSRGCQIPIVFLTVHEDEEFVCAARAAGGLGYVLKSRMASDLRPAIEAAHNDRPFVSERLQGC